MNTESNNSTDGDAVTYMPADRRDWLGRQAGSNPTRSIDAQIVVDPEARTVCADYDVCLHGTPADIWHGRRLVIAVNPKGGVPDAAATMTWLEREHATTIAAICDGYTCEWDGHNHIGRLDEDATAALERLQDALDHAPTLPDDAGVGDVGDWCGCSEDLLEWCAEIGHPITADTDEAGLVAATKAVEAAAIADLRLMFGVYDALRDLRDDMAREREGEAEEE